VINRSYTRLWAGQATSLVGDFAFDTAVITWIGTALLRDRGYAPAVSSAALVIVAVVAIVVGPIAGVYVDRWDARRTMLGTDLIRGILVGLLTGLSCMPTRLVPTWVMLGTILLVLVGTSIAAQFFSPARFVLLTQVLEDKDQSKAAALAQATSAGAMIIGPPLGALMLVNLGPQWAIGLNAASYLISLLCIRGVRPYGQPIDQPEPASAAPRSSQLTAGLRLILGERTLRAMLIAAFIATLGTGAINALDLYFVLENLHASPAWFGTLEALFACGTLLGAWLGHELGKRTALGAVFYCSMLCNGGLVLAYSRVSQVTAAAAITVLFGMSLGALNTVAFPLILTKVPRSHLGRVMAVFNPANKLASLVSIGLSSLLITTVLRNLQTSFAGVQFGRIDTVFTISGIFMLAAGFYAWRSLRISAEPALSPDPTKVATDSRV
jgi:MFS family permease